MWYFKFIYSFLSAITANMMKYLKKLELKHRINIARIEENYNKIRIVYKCLSILYNQYGYITNDCKLIKY